MNKFSSISKPVENATLRVLSFGAGVQSTVMLLMAAKGEIKPMPNVAIFADTQFEPTSIYNHLDWCKEELKRLTNDRVQLEIVTAGNLKENEIRYKDLKNRDFSSIPYFTETGLAKRQCTAHYKINPIRKSIRNKLGVKFRQKVPSNTFVEQWIGISTDELERVKEARDKWIIHRFPLIEMGMSRGDCYQWFKKHYPNKPLVKSACIGCPYRPNSAWKDMKKNDPVSWEIACQFDEKIRDNQKFKNITQYVHSSATRLRTADLGDDKTPDLFLGECDGMCGV